MGAVSECTRAEVLIGGIDAEYPLAERGCDANGVLAAARARGIVPVILPKRSRKMLQSYDEALYETRHLVENCFVVEVMAWRRVMSRKRRCTCDLPDTCLGAVCQSNLTTRPSAFHWWKLACIR